jgi:MoaA/NifB/PqqE/SkfB family radical SAM enzyme
MISFDQIRKIHVELTTRCNARCPMCMRNYRGYEFNSGYPDCELTLDDFKKIITTDIIHHVMQPTTGVDPNNQGFNFNGNLGDFASARDALEIVEYLVSNGARVCINTNGSLRNISWWEKLAKLNVQVGFAIDGLADTHSLYRQDTNWNKIIDNASAFISAGGEAIWRFIPFDHNRHQADACQQMSKDLGFKKFENIYDGRDRTPVYTRQGQFSHNIGEPYPGPVPAVKDMLESHITWFSAGTAKSDKDLPQLKLFCTHRVNREIYIAANGTVYPCCYLGFYPATMNHPGNSQLKPLVFENNALEHGLEHCLQWFESVEESWSKKSIADGRLYHCVSNCGRL